MTIAYTRPKLADLEAERLEIDAQIRAAAAEPSLAAAHRSAKQELDIAGERYERARVLAVQGASLLDSDKRTLPLAAEHLEKTRCCAERLQAAAAREWGIIDSYDESIRSLEFYVANHPLKLKARQAALKAAQAGETATSAALKVAQDRYTQAEKALTELRTAAELAEDIA